MPPSYLKFPQWPLEGRKQMFVLVSPGLGREDRSPDKHTEGCGSGARDSCGFKKLRRASRSRSGWHRLCSPS